MLLVHLTQNLHQAQMMERNTVATPSELSLIPHQYDIAHICGNIVARPYPTSYRIFSTLKIKNQDGVFVEQVLNNQFYF